MTNKQRLAAGAATVTLAFAGLSASPALAQSTASQVQELIVTGTRTPPSTGGLAVRVNEAKDVSIINQKFIQTQLPSQNVGQLINFLPGVSNSTEDPGGFNSGDLRIHGFECNPSGGHIAVAIDGAPVTDTGNYACYFGEYIIGELVDHVTVNIGSSDVDNPSASALGASINVVTKTPPNTFGMFGKLSYGSYNYTRGYGEIDTGQFGPWGTTAFFGGEYGHEDNFKGRPGDSNRWSLNAKIYQPLRDNDFVSLIASYTQERQYPAFDASAAGLIAAGDPYFSGDNYTWAPETATPGVADTVPSPNPHPAGTDANYWLLFPNPVNFFTARGQSQFAITRNLSFTFDPTFFYTLANGGGGTTLKETDPRLIGSSAVAGVDMNGDGDTKDTVVVYGPSNTETYRYGVTSSLLYDMDEHNHFQLAYTLDWGHHRQTGEYTTVNPLNGDPTDVFAAKPGYGPPIITGDGSILRKRDRLSIAMLNQVSANYIGKFVDDRLHINVGVRAPFFQRDINQYCYTYNGTSAWCDTVSQSAVQTAYNTDLAANRNPGQSAAALTSLLGTTVSTGLNGAPNFRFPFSQTFKWNKLLPNAGVSFRLAEEHMIYVSYARGFAAPKTDDLYTSTGITVQPETSDNITGGYRFQSRRVTLSVNGYYADFHNRIVQSYDPTDPTLSIDRNVGDVHIWGADLEAGLTLFEHLNLYGSANFNKSQLQSNYIVQTAGTTFALPTKGKELVMTPDRTFAARATYDWGPFTFGGEMKYISSRWVSDVNDASIPGYTVFNFDARLALPQMPGSYLQFNVLNAFDKYYFTRTTTVSNSLPYPIPGTALTYSPSTNFLYVGAPRTLSVTLGVKF
jgi:iron complex outermembrane receptor protein